MPSDPAMANTAGATPISGESVFNAFHGKDGINRIIDDFVTRVTTDPRIAERFRNANLDRLRFELKAQGLLLPDRRPVRLHRQGYEIRARRHEPAQF